MNKNGIDRWSFDDDYVELADRLNADRCMWLWHTAYHTLPGFLFRLQTLFETDQRATNVLERQQLRTELMNVSVAFQCWERLDFGYADFVRQLSAFIEYCEGGLDRFLSLVPSVESFTEYVDHANDVAEKRQTAEPFGELPFDPFPYLRLLPPDMFAECVPAILKDTWWVIRASRLLNRLHVYPEHIDLLFADIEFRKSVNNFATDVSTLISTGVPKNSCRSIVTTRKLATEAGLSESTIRALKAEGVIKAIPGREGGKGKSAHWDLESTLAILKMR